MGKKEGCALKKACDIYYQPAWLQGEQSPPALLGTQPFCPSLEHPPMLGPDMGSLTAQWWLRDTGTRRAVMAEAWLPRQSPACRFVGQVPSCQEPQHARQVVIHLPCSPTPEPSGSSPHASRTGCAQGTELRVPWGCPCYLSTLVLPSLLRTYSYRAVPARASRRGRLHHPQP